jgi:O-methyltransferase
MAGRLLAVEPETDGVVVECGCFKGGSSANLSLACALVHRELHVYDSFAGLPEPEKWDQDHALARAEVVHHYEQGMYTGTYDEVQGNIRSYGALESCRLIPGYFADSLREYRTPCVLAFIDVDLRDSLEDCVRAIWSHMAPGSALFVHEAEHHETAAFFFDTEWWRRELDCEPPGLIGAGSGVGLWPRAGMWGSSLGFAIKDPDRDDYQHVIAPG